MASQALKEMKAGRKIKPFSWTMSIQQPLVLTSSKVHVRAALGRHVITPLVNCFQVDKIPWLSIKLPQLMLRWTCIPRARGRAGGPVYHQPHSVLLPRFVKPENAAAPFLSAPVLGQPLQCSLVSIHLSHPCREARALTHSSRMRTTSVLFS